MGVRWSFPRCVPGMGYFAVCLDTENKSYAHSKGAEEHLKETLNNMKTDLFGPLEVHDVREERESLRC